MARPAARISRAASGPTQAQWASERTQTTSRKRCWAAARVARTAARSSGEAVLAWLVMAALASWERNTAEAEEPPQAEQTAAGRAPGRLQQEPEDQQRHDPAGDGRAAGPHVAAGRQEQRQAEGTAGQGVEELAEAEQDAHAAQGPAGHGRHH